MVGRLASSTIGVGPELWGVGCKAVSALHVRRTNRISSIAFRKLSLLVPLSHLVVLKACSAQPLYIGKPKVGSGSVPIVWLRLSKQRSPSALSRNDVESSPRTSCRQE